MNDQLDTQTDAEKRTETMTGSITMTDAKATKLFDATSLKIIQSALKRAPLPPKKLNKSGALYELVPELKRQRVRGHTVASLAAVLDAGGLRISEKKIAQLLRHQANVSLA